MPNTESCKAAEHNFFAVDYTPRNTSKIDQIPVFKLLCSKCGLAIPVPAL
jgi:hypothetical protein